MAFSQETKNDAWSRAGGQCECTRAFCPDHIGRCPRLLIAGEWDANHVRAQAADGGDSLSNCEALCVPCHKDMLSYGRHE